MRMAKRSSFPIATRLKAGDEQDLVNGAQIKVKGQTLLSLHVYLQELSVASSKALTAK